MLVIMLLKDRILDKKTRISFSGKPGEDIHSMANCIEKFGIEIKKNEKYLQDGGMNIEKL